MGCTGATIRETEIQREKESQEEFVLWCCSCCPLRALSICLPLHLFRVAFSSRCSSSVPPLHLRLSLLLRSSAAPVGGKSTSGRNKRTTTQRGRESTFHSLTPSLTHSARPRKKEQEPEPPANKRSLSLSVSQSLSLSVCQSAALSLACLACLACLAGWVAGLPACLPAVPVSCVLCQAEAADGLTAAAARPHARTRRSVDVNGAVRCGWMEPNFRPRSNFVVVGGSSCSRDGRRTLTTHSLTHSHTFTWIC